MAEKFIKKYTIPHQNSKEQIRNNFKLITGDYFSSLDIMFLGKVEGDSFSLNTSIDGNGKWGKSITINITIKDDVVEVEKLYSKTAHDMEIIVGVVAFISFLACIGTGIPIWIPIILSTTMLIGAIFFSNTDYDSIIKWAVESDGTRPPLKSPYQFKVKERKFLAKNPQKEKKGLKFTIPHNKTKEEIINNFNKYLSVPYCPFIGNIKENFIELKPKKEYLFHPVTRVELIIMDNKVCVKKIYVMAELIFECIFFFVFLFGIVTNFLESSSFSSFYPIPAFIILYGIIIYKEVTLYNKELKKIIQKERSFYN